jgi:hypothetical protein
LPADPGLVSLSVTGSFPSPSPQWFVWRVGDHVQVAKRAREPEDEPEREERRRFERGADHDAFSTDDPEALAAAGVPVEDTQAFGAWRRPRQRRPRPQFDAVLEWILARDLGALGVTDVTFVNDDMLVGGRVVGRGIRRRIVRGGGWYDREHGRVDLPRFVGRFAPDLVKLQAQPHLKAVNKRLWLQRADDGFEVMRGAETVVARVTATAFTSAEGEQVRGAFFVQGKHWEQAVPCSPAPATRRSAPAAT